jgi:hypothetical protein
MVLIDPSKLEVKPVLLPTASNLVTALPNWAEADSGATNTPINKNKISIFFIKKFIYLE